MQVSGEKQLKIKQDNGAAEQLMKEVPRGVWKENSRYYLNKHV